MDTNDFGRTVVMPLSLVVIALLIALPMVVEGQMPGGMQQQQNPGSAQVVVEEIAFSDEEPDEGDEVTITAKVKNNATIDITDIVVMFLVDGEEIGNTSGISLELNGTTVVEQTWEAEGYTHVVSVMVVINGMPLTDSQATEEIYVEPEPIGNLITPVLLLLVIVGVILITTIIPSIIDLVRGNGKK